MTFFMLILDREILKRRNLGSYWFWCLILKIILFLPRYKHRRLFVLFTFRRNKKFSFCSIFLHNFSFCQSTNFEIIFCICQHGVFLKTSHFWQNSKGNPFKNSILGPLFWAVLDARSFFETFFGKCPFGGGDQKKVRFLHFFVKIEKISKFGLFPLTYYILERFRHVPFWKNIATRG